MNTHRLINQHSMTTEVLGLLHAVVSRNKLPNMVPSELSDLVLELSQMQFLMNEPSLIFVCLEMLLFIDERHDMEQFLVQYNTLTNDQLRYCLLSGSVNLSHIIGADEKDIQSFANELDINDYKSYMEYLNNPRDFYNPIMDLANKIFNLGSFKAMFTPEIKEKIEQHYIQLKEELENRHPLSYAQSIMGKSFYNIADWDRYEFLYVYTIYPYKARLMDEHQNIMLISLLDRQWNDQEHIKKIQKQMKLIADPTRMSILRMIYSNPMYGKEIAEKLSLTTATVSHHLDQMNKESLIHIERDKNTKYYSTNQRSLNILINEIKKYISNL